jgi:DNA-binding transcriptional regulator GbsR (MarR family)
MNKEEFKAKAKQYIDEISAKIHEMEANKESVKSDAQSKYKETIKELNDKKDVLQAKYENLENIAEDKLEETKLLFSSAAKTFEEQVSKISGLFS